MNISKVSFTYVLLVLLLLSGCGPSAYLTASGNFAKALDDSTSTLRGMKDYNSQMCQQRMQLDYLFHRIENKKSGDSPIYWANYSKEFKYKVKQTDGTDVDQDWDTHCKQVQISDAIVNKALSGISAYANALNTLTAKDYSASNMKSLSNDVIDLAGKLNTPSKVTDIAKALPDPIQQLTGVLLAMYAKKEIKKVVKEADPSVTKILDGIGKYLDALIVEELDVENQMRNTINAADAGLSGDSMEYLQFNELASRWVSDLQAKKDAQQMLSSALKKLRDAENALATAGKQPDPDTADELKIVLGNATVVIGDIQALNNAIQGKGGN